MQVGGIGPSLLRILGERAPDLVARLFASGGPLEAEVVSVFQDRAVLAFGRGVRLDVSLQAPLEEGQRVKLAVQPGSDASPMVLKLISAEPAHPPEGRTDASQGQTTGWLPIPLPGGEQGWAQIHVQEEPLRKGRGPNGQPAHQVRLWWETPALGAVQVTLDAAGDDLTALFTAALAQSGEGLRYALPELQRRLAGAGFPGARVGCRQARPGEPIEPLRPDGAHRFDRRI